VKEDEYGNMVDAFCMYENRTMKFVEIALRSRGEGKREKMDEVNLRYIVSAYVNITPTPCTDIIC
jgi:hypothetical protein